MLKKSLENESLFYNSTELPVDWTSIESKIKLCYLYLFQESPRYNIYVSSKIINSQKDLFFKEHSWSRRFSILFSILSIIVFMISYFHIWNKIQRRVWQNIWKNVFEIAILYFGTRRPNFFHNVIFNQWGQLSAGSIKYFFWRSIVTP